MITWYVSIKLAEWTIWTAIGIVLLVQTSRARGKPAWLGTSLAMSFFVFGGADFIEFFTNGTFPWWLWAWKIAGGLALFALLVTRDYLKRGRAAIAPWRFAVVALILGMAVLCISAS